MEKNHIQGGNPPRGHPLQGETYAKRKPNAKRKPKQRKPTLRGNWCPGETNVEGKPTPWGNQCRGETDTEGKPTKRENPQRGEATSILVGCDWPGVLDTNRQTERWTRALCYTTQKKNLHESKFAIWTFQNLEHSYSFKNDSALFDLIFKIN